VLVFELGLLHVLYIIFTNEINLFFFFLKKDEINFLKTNHIFKLIIQNQNHIANKS